MQLFLDTANIEEIREGVTTGIVSGVTTNPSIISRENKPLGKCISDIFSVDPGLTLLVEGISMETEDMIKEAREISNISDNIVIKIPMTISGIAAVKALSKESIKTAVTLVFSLNQAIVASCAGANYVAPFVGRLDDINAGGVKLVKDIKKLFDIQKTKTEIIAASIRTPQAVAELFSAGCDIITLTIKIFKAMFKHSLTDLGIKQFIKDWEKVPE